MRLLGDNTIWIGRQTLRPLHKTLGVIRLELIEFESLFGRQDPVVNLRGQLFFLNNQQSQCLCLLIGQRLYFSLIEISVRRQGFHLLVRGRELLQQRNRGRFLGLPY